MNKSNNALIEKGERISNIISDIKGLEQVLDTLDCNIQISIGTTSSGNIMKYSIFREIMWEHISKIKKEIPVTIDKLRKELDALIK